MLGRKVGGAGLAGLAGTINSGAGNDPFGDAAQNRPLHPAPVGPSMPR